jgi:hypothetical protein
LGAAYAKPPGVAGAEYDRNVRVSSTPAGSGSRAAIGFATDSPLEGGVSCELVSEIAKFPASWENTGNFADSGLSGAWEAAKKDTKSVSYAPIPYASEQGIF